MEDRLIDNFLKYSSLTREEIEAIKQSIELKIIGKGDYITAKQANTNSYFILAGLVMQFTSANDEEIPTDFFIEGEWIVSPDGNNKLVCLEDTTLVVGNEQKALLLFEQFPRLEAISGAIMEDIYKQKNESMSQYIASSHEQRYINLMEQRPQILQRVPQYYIARYIGVAPESLSRIRRRIFS